MRGPIAALEFSTDATTMLWGTIPAVTISLEPNEKYFKLIASVSIKDALKLVPTRLLWCFLTCVLVEAFEFFAPDHPRQTSPEMSTAIWIGGLIVLLIFYRYFLTLLVTFAASVLRATRPQFYTLCSLYGVGMAGWIYLPKFVGAAFAICMFNVMLYFDNLVEFALQRDEETPFLPEQARTASV